MSNDFLEEQNFKFLINFVFNDIKQKGYNVNNSKYLVIFKKLIQTIHAKNLNKNVSKEHLNTLVIDKCTPFIIKQIEKDMKKNKPIQNIPDLYSSPRPISSDNQNIQDFSHLTLDNDSNNSNNMFNTINTQKTPKFNQKNFDEFSRERNYGNNNDEAMKKLKLQNSFDKSVNLNSSDEDNVDIMKKMMEMQNERQYVNQNDSQNNFMEQTKSLVREDNKVLQNINTENNNNFIPKTQDNDNLNEILQNLNNNYMESQNNSNNINDSYNSTNFQVAQNNVNNLSMTIKDSSNTIQNSIDNIDNLKENQNINNFNQDVTKYVDNTFLNTNYNFTVKKRVLVVDVSNNLPDFTSTYTDNNGDTQTQTRPVINNISGNYWHNFRVELQEELIIDKTLDVYLESITVNNPAQSNKFSNSYFVIDIAEFNIKTNTNNPFMQDKFIIPNENIESSSTSKVMKYHLKSNYLAQINPMTLDKLNFTITNENNESVNDNINTSVSLTINNGGGYAAGVTEIVVDDGTNISVNDSLFDKNNSFIGTVTAKDNNTLTITTTQIKLADNQQIFISNFKTNVLINEANGYQLNTETITVDGGGGDASTLFPKDTNIYLGNGDFVGRVTSSTTTTIKIRNGSNVILSDNDILYNGNPLETVFKSNSKTNRMIMEFIFLSK